MNDRRTDGKAFLDPLLIFPTSAQDLAARLTGGAVLAAAAASQGLAFGLACSAFAYGYGGAGLKHLQAYSHPWLLRAR